MEIFSKDALVVLLKDKNSVSVVNEFPKILKDLMENQTRYGLTKEANFTIAFLKND